jgi:glutathione S-transferase
MPASFKPLMMVLAASPAVTPFRLFANLSNALNTKTGLVQAVFARRIFAFSAAVSVRMTNRQIFERSAQMLKLYDFKSSPNCQRVKVVLEEKKIPYETINIDLRAGEQKTPDYLKINPYGKVPALADNDTILYESCIINEYLDEKYSTPRLMPSDPAQRAKARILVDFGLTQMDPVYTKLRMEMVKDEKERSQETINAAKQDIKKRLQHLEQELGNKEYLLGDFSLVDADLIPRFTRLEGFGVLPDPALPGLGKYLQRMKERPSVKAIL